MILKQHEGAMYGPDPVRKRTSFHFPWGWFGLGVAWSAVVFLLVCGYGDSCGFRHAMAALLTVWIGVFIFIGDLIESISDER